MDTKTVEYPWNVQHFDCPTNDCLLSSLVWSESARIALSICWLGHGLDDTGLESRQGWERLGVKLTTHFSVVPRLRLSGAIPLLPSYVVESETVLLFLTVARYAVRNCTLCKANTLIGNLVSVNVIKAEGGVEVQRHRLVIRVLDRGKWSDSCQDCYFQQRPLC
jgi:hypothetical protein